MLQLKILKLDIELENQRKTIICFINQNYIKKAFLNRKGLSNIDRSSIGLSNANNIFINENLIQ